MEITYEKLEQLFDHKLEPLRAELASIKEVQERHSAALDSIAQDVKVLLHAKIVSEYRLEKIEHWAQKVGHKVGVELEQ